MHTITIYNMQDYFKSDICDFWGVQQIIFECRQGDCHIAVMHEF